MKKLIFSVKNLLLMGALFIGLSVGVMTYLSANSTKNANLALANIEALANEEQSGCDGAPGKCGVGGCYTAHCKASATIELGGYGFTFGETITVEVTAQEGAFACCYETRKFGLRTGLYAHCYPNSCCN